MEIGKNFLINAANTLRQQVGNYLLGVSKDGQRDIYDVFGYTRVRNFDNYFEAFRLQDIAGSIVTSLPSSCWRDGVELFVDDKPVLEDELKVLKKRKLFQKLEAADVLNRIGSFSVLYVGIAGQNPMDPIMPVAGGVKHLNKVFFKPYAEDGIIISNTEGEVTNERFGLPTMYQLTVRTRTNSSQPIQEKTVNVHWSRIVHLAEGALDSEIEGLPALENILNRLVDLNKSVGGSAEAFFRNARQKIVLEADDKDFKNNFSPEAKADLDTATEAFQNGWQDFIKLHGIKAKSLDAPYHDPKETVMAAVKMISGATKIPIRILLGEGAGQLAGNEDKDSYNNLIDQRQKLWCCNWLERLFEILAAAGLLAIPDNMDIKFPINEAMNEKQKSEVTKNNSEAMVNISTALAEPNGLAGEMSAEQAITEVLGLEYIPVTDGADDPIPDEVIPEEPEEKE